MRRRLRGEHTEGDVGVERAGEAGVVVVVVVVLGLGLLGLASWLAVGVRVGMGGTRRCAAHVC